MSRRVLLGFGALLVGWLAPAAASAAPTGQDPAPPSIFNGTEADACAYPSVVGMLDRDTGGLFCSGTLIHPQLVLFAAHCMDPDDSWATPGSIMLGESVTAPVRPIPSGSASTCPTAWSPRQ